MRVPTERQTRRREGILTAARTLIVERGYDGVTMRDLAAQSGVTPKTLYHQFGSKEKLLRAAVEERFRLIYEKIDAAQFEHGIDRLFFIVDSVAESTRQNRAYAKALTPILSDPHTDTYTAIRMNSYRRATLQIEQEGGFLDWVNVGLIASVIYRQVNPIYFASWYAKVPKGAMVDVVKLDISLVLASVTRGYTKSRALESVRALQMIRDSYL